MTAIHEEEHIHSHDNQSLFFQRWRPEGDTEPKGQLLVVHGYGEHGARYRELAHVLATHGIVTSAVDLRGHGHSDGQRGYIDSFTHYLNDVDVALGKLDDSLPRFILGHSLGGLISLDFVCGRRPSIDGLIISNPFLELAMPVPPAKRKLAEIAGTFLPRLAVPNGIKPEFISRDRDICDRYVRDPLVFGIATAGWVRETTAAQERVLTYDRITTPLLYLYSDSDPIAHPDASRRLSAQLTGPDKTVVERPDELHEILNELNRQQLHQEVAEWIRERM